ncbi:MAG: hypothetical protein ABI442_11250 [Gemmatimonadaceae bacterium]
MVHPYASLIVGALIAVWRIILFDMRSACGENPACSESTSDRSSRSLSPLPRADTPTAAPKPTPARGTAKIAFAPIFSSAARAAAARLADFGISFDHVRVMIVRPVADTVKDMTIAFAPGQSDVTLDLDVAVRQDGESFHVAIDYTSNRSRFNTRPAHPPRGSRFRQRRRTWWLRRP